ncbi:MAG: hypothetical protein EON54_06320 [Alcaligenaceae bacterium]|nr:MAG: hypothetical protein EON54_06320 [Alcaligenaceae bacterium]
MTIGSSYEYPAHRATALRRALAQPALATNWSVPFPNPPDLCFDYRKLVEGGPVATPKDKALKIGIIGAGMTGLTAARELFRCGFDDITVFESSDRIAGRHRTITDVAERQYSM